MRRSGVRLREAALGSLYYSGPGFVCRSHTSSPPRPLQRSRPVTHDCRDMRHRLLELSMAPPRNTAMGSTTAWTHQVTSAPRLPCTSTFSRHRWTTSRIAGRRHVTSLVTPWVYAISERTAMAMLDAWCRGSRPMPMSTTNTSAPITSMLATEVARWNRDGDAAVP